MKHFMNIHITKTVVRRQRSLHSPFSMYEIHVRWMRDCRVLAVLLSRKWTDRKAAHKPLRELVHEASHFPHARRRIVSEMSVSRMSPC
jgi:hypothetical protein